MLKRLARPFVLLLTAALLTGCTTLGSELVAPSLEVTGVQMLSSDMFAQRFKVRVLIKNPNDLELPVKGLDYQIILMGDSFAEGVASNSFVLPALGEAEFDMLVTTNFVSSFGRLISRVGGGKLEDIDYEITGKIFVDKGVLRRIPFSHRGTVDFSRALKSGKSEPRQL